MIFLNKLKIKIRNKPPNKQIIKKITNKSKKILYENNDIKPLKIYNKVHIFKIYRWIFGLIKFTRIDIIRI